MSKKATRNRMTAKRLAQLMRYHPDTGVLTWIAPLSARVKVGEPVGSNHSRGYLELSADNVRMFAHQAAWLLMTGEWPKTQIDHINGDRKDNRWANLRLAQQQQNSANMRRRSNNRSGYKGVVETKPGVWIAYIHIAGKTHYLGTFQCPQKAHAAYQEAARSAWGEYARAA